MKKIGRQSDPLAIGRKEGKRSLSGASISPSFRRSETLNEAIDSWQALSKREQLATAIEAVATRAEEWKKLYPGVVSLGAGRKLRGRGAGTLTDEVGIAFVVKKKWPRKLANSAKYKDRKIPAFIASHATVQGTRRLCAIPTDVIDRKIYSKVRPHNRYIVTGRAPTEVVGVVCCAVTVPGRDGRVYALGCHHVFALSDKLWPAPQNVDMRGPADVTPQGGGTFTLNNAGTSFANLSDVTGSIGWDSSHSWVEVFDAALAEVTDSAAFSPTVTGPGSGNPVLSTYSGLSPDDEYSVGTARGQVTGALWGVHIDFDEIAYDVIRQNVGTPTKAFCVIELRTATPLLPGDSGSPVFASDGTFVGMHIAGDESTRGFFIPAYELLAMRNYPNAGGGPGDTFSVVNA